jgi:UDP-galactopyranose mutase
MVIRYTDVRPHATDPQPTREDAADAVDVVVFSHLRWDFVSQRPQHLLSRCARNRRVFFVEEPTFHSESNVRLETSERDCGVTVAVPRLPEGLTDDEVWRAQRALVDELLLDGGASDYVAWFYTPMALAFAGHLRPRAIVYDCMDELSAFRNAPAALRRFEAELFSRADVVFTGGHSLYEAKRDLHQNIHAFPSSIDGAHFGRARQSGADPQDQAGIGRPRLGFFGVIDERMDLDLVAAAADMRPDWQFVMIGPVVKIDPASLPQRPNLHYLGGKRYEELPEYIAGWDVAIMPFALNESTRFISPTKTPEYLAAGRPVVSTSIRDVVEPYGTNGLVEIADTPDEFTVAVERVLARDGAERSERLERVDAFLADMSWDATWQQMWSHIASAVESRAASSDARTN